MASNTFTIEICDQDRRRIDALVEALKKSEELSKRLEQVEAWLIAAKVTSQSNESTAGRSRSVERLGSSSPKGKIHHVKRRE
jgi:hypothetical protein